MVNKIYSLIVANNYLMTIMMPDIVLSGINTHTHTVNFHRSPLKVGYQYFPSSSDEASVKGRD